MPNYAGNADQGVATLAFAAGGANQASVIVGGTPIQPGAYIDMYLTRVAGGTTDEHLVAPIKLRVGEIIPGRGFTIYGEVDAPVAQRTYGPRCPAAAPKLSGNFGVAWSWRKPN
jgi:hypothetical protein